MHVSKKLSSCAMRLFKLKLFPGVIHLDSQNRAMRFLIHLEPGCPRCPGTIDSDSHPKVPVKLTQKYAVFILGHK